MYTAEAPPRPVHRRFQGGGPPLAGLAAVSAALFLASLIIGAAMAKGTFPSPFDSGASILTYFRDHQQAVRSSGAEVSGSRPASV
jgi:hypothetical protein